MAIDTAAKQMAMLNLSDGTNLLVLPIPGAAYDSADRQHLLDCYSGIAFDATVPEFMAAIDRRWNEPYPERMEFVSY